MHTLKRLLYAAILTSIAGMANAQSLLNGCYDITGETSRLCVEVRANNLGQSTAFGVVLKSDNSWTIFMGAVSDARVTATQSIFRNGSAFGMAYRMPTGSAGGPVSINFVTREIDYGTGAKGLTRREFVANGLVFGTPFNTPPTGWYVSRIRSEEGRELAEEPGVGYFFEGQGTAGELHIAGYDETGAPKWWTITGSMPMNSGFIGFLTGTLKLGGTTDAGTIMLQGRQTATLAVYPPGETLIGLNVERWLTRFNF